MAAAEAAVAAEAAAEAAAVAAEAEAEAEAAQREVEVPEVEVVAGAVISTRHGRQVRATMLENSVTTYAPPLLDPAMVTTV